MNRLAYIIAMVLAGGVMSLRSAHAQVLVEDTLVVAGVTALNAEVLAANALQLKLNTYLMTGLPPLPGDGLINQLSGINAHLALSNGFEREFFANMDVSQRTIERDRLLKDKVRIDAQPSTSTYGCHDATVAYGRAGAGGAAVAAQASIESNGESALRGDPTGAGALYEVIKDRKLFCDESDIATVNGTRRSRFGCTEVGTMPGANTRPASLFEGATEVQGQPTNHSLDPEQLKAAEAYIRNIEPMAIGQPGPAVQESPGGAAFMVHWERFVARVQAVRRALAQVVSSKAAIGSTDYQAPSAVTDAFLTNWRSGSFQAKWEEMFPGTKFPEKPSEYDLLSYTVHSLYADAALVTQNQVIPEKDLVRHQVAAAATQNKLLLTIVDRMETQNVLMSALLSNNLDPVTRQELEARTARIGTDPAAL